MSRSYFLGAVPSALSGVARILDIGGTFDSYNSSSTEDEADAKAHGMDWQLVGDDLRRAIYDARVEIDREQRRAAV